MDFDFAAQRFARDQQKLRAKQQHQQQRSTAVSAKAQRELVLRQQQQARLLAQKRTKERQQQFIQQYMHDCDRQLHVQSIAQNFTATSIHGEGDKIALPPSVLERLTQQNNPSSQSSSSSPWMFRIALLNPDYQFPASPALQQMKPPPETDDTNNYNEDEDDAMDVDSDDDSDDDDEHALTEKVAAYQHELQHKYLAFTYGTVVEFTQDEGHVGLPASIAQNLLQQANHGNQNNQSTATNSTPVPTFRTVDPAATVTKTPSNDETNNADDTEMMTHSSPPNHEDNDDEEKTPGHIAYGAFDLPQYPIDISLVQLPKGHACTLVPTAQALRNNFYGVQDIKLMLEQSLIRTRAVLAVGDIVHAWHRGKQYNVFVSHVTPAAYGAISIINTDLTVEFGSAEESEQQKGEESKSEETVQQSTNATSTSGGYTLAGSRPTESSSSSSSTGGNNNDTTTASSASAEAVILPEEPPESATDILLVQIRSSSGGSIQRRLSVTHHSLTDLFTVAQSMITNTTGFRLVTRFPRRVWEMPTKSDEDKSLQEAGFSAGKELLMVEFL